MEKDARWEIEWNYNLNCIRKGSDKYFFNSDRLTPHLEEYSARGLLGKVILDMGCGPHPISDELDLTCHRRILLDLIDYVHELKDLPDNPITVKADLNVIEADKDNSKSDTKNYLDALEGVSKEVGYKGIDVILATAILNYIDYKAVFKRLNGDLRANGHVFIANGLNIGLTGFKHEKRPQSNEEIFEYFEKDLGYKIMYKEDYPHLVLIAQKGLKD